ncbi:hypothetical protein [Hymenobacter ruricola]|uniref:VOC domain-containing protein n=1 Tax=Hymenobacter ruricola TaxID=2791023 RepID=A0ABS0I455_9BACT|nr:hypothetical protein [Hymenobacter ruricola]MBF9221707.1 hypothetical protein [Hymenobacter ruricola]
MNPDYHLTAFWAIDEPAEALAFYHGHQRVLQRHGLEAVGSGGPDWLGDPNVLVVLARDAEGNPAGGIRLHRSRPGRPLPLVAALAAAHPDILPVLAPALLLGAAESCGLWVAAWHGRRGLPQLLVRYSVALAPGWRPACTAWPPRTPWPCPGPWASSRFATLASRAVWRTLRQSTNPR